MKLNKILFLFFIIIASSLTSCQVVPRDQYEGRQASRGGYEPEYGPPPGARMRRPMPQQRQMMRSDDGYQSANYQPSEQFHEQRGPRRHWNARFNRATGTAMWTLDGKPISADMVPERAKSGFEAGLRKRGYTGPINHSSNGGISAPAPAAPSFSTPEQGDDPIPEASGAAPLTPGEMVSL